MFKNREQTKKNISQKSFALIHGIFAFNHFGITEFKLKY